MTAAVRIMRSCYQDLGSVQMRGLDPLRDGLHRPAGDRNGAVVRANPGFDDHKTADLVSLLDTGSHTEGMSPA